MSRLSTVLLACLLPVSAFAAPVTYVMDPLHSFPNFSVNHLGMSTIHGRFDRMTGTITLDQAAKTGSLEAKIASNSVNSGDAKRADGTRARDEHLRSADFFNSAEFPDVVFKSTKFNFKGEELESVDGTLTMLGVTKPVKLSVTAFKCAPHPFNKKPMCGADVQTSFKRTDWGMKFGVPGIGDEVKMNINIEAYPQ
ncbi:MAG: YceI family protein [Pseudomonadota bacterium]